jgi:2-keto-4-pentenoate hydratase/2-oxohepta-3-ene-1,7-dioic acid hydratase in catechol pathway
MKLATFRIHTPLGGIDRFGIAANLKSRTVLIDANAAYAAYAHDQGHPCPAEKANAFCPADLMHYCALYGIDTSLLRTVEEFVWHHAETADIRTLLDAGGRRLVYALDEVRLRPPVPRVPVLRDFAAFEDHLENTFSRMGLKIPPVWYEQPTAFKANSTSIIGHDDPVVWPRYTEKLDFELEVAAVIGVPGRNVACADANRHILGYTLLNDFSARDTQRGEMAISTGPFKGKDFAWGLGPWIVTCDELGDPSSLQMRVRINGETWVESTPGPMQWSFPEVVSYTSQDETLNIGDVIGSGTVNGGCGFEIDRWIKQGDVVELEADRIGVLRNRVMDKSPESQVRWRRG